MIIIKNKSEVYETLFKYFGHNETNTVRFFGNGNSVKKLFDLLPEHLRDDIRPEALRDAPDLYMKDGETVYIIEHFEFDCYKHKRKGGSSYRLEDARINEKVKEITPTEEGVIMHDTINAESSYDYYTKNVTALFNKHYKNIPVYIENLKRISVINNESEIKTMFLIDDVTPLGTTAYKREKGYGGEMVPITLARCIDFLELLKDKKDVNYVLACSKIESHDYIWFIDTEELDEYIDNIEDYKNMTFLSFKPHVMYGEMIVSPERFKEQ